MKITNNNSLSNPATFQGKINQELIKKLQNPAKEFKLQILNDSFAKAKPELSKEDREILREATKRDFMQDIQLYAERLATKYLTKNKK